MCPNCRDFEQHAADLLEDARYLGEMISLHAPGLLAQLAESAGQRFVPYVPFVSPLDEQLAG